MKNKLQVLADEFRSRIVSEDKEMEDELRNKEQKDTYYFDREIAERDIEPSEEANKKVNLELQFAIEETEKHTKESKTCFLE